MPDDTRIDDALGALDVLSEALAAELDAHSACYRARFKARRLVLGVLGAPSPEEPKITSDWIDWAREQLEAAKVAPKEGGRG